MNCSNFIPVLLASRDASDFVRGIVVSRQHAEQLCGMHGKERAMNLLDNIEAIKLLHGEWGEFKEMLTQSGWNIEGRWVEHVHSSLSRLILHASIVPLN